MTAPSLARNTLYTAAALVSQWLLLFLTLTLVARTLGADGLGVLSFALAISTILVSCTDLGLENLAILRISRDPGSAGRIIYPVLAWKFLLAGAMGAVFAALVAALVTDAATRTAALLLCAAGIVRALNLFLRGCLRALNRFELETPVVVIESAVLLAGSGLLLFTGHGVVYVAAAFILSRSVALLLFLYRIARLTHVRPERPRLRLLRRFQAEALPFGFAVIVLAMYTQVDIVLLSALAPLSAVGLYGSAYRIFEGLHLVPFIAAQAAYPRLSSLHASDPEGHVELFHRVLKYLLVLACITAVVGVTYGTDLITLVFGARFRDAGGALSLLVIAAALSFLNTGLSMGLRSVGRQNLALRVNLLSLGTRVVLGLALIPEFSVIGAGLACLGTEVVALAAWTVLAARLRLRIAMLRGVALRLFAITLAAALLAVFGRGLPWPVGLLLVVGGYTAGLLVLEVFDESERRRVLDAVSRRAWPSRGR